MISEVLLDMDGVLVDFVSGAEKLHNVKLYEDTSRRSKWNCNEFIGMTFPEFSAKMDAEFWTNLDWMPDGQQILRILEDRFGKENICLLSNPLNCPKAMEGKSRWISRHMPDYGNRYLFGPAKFFAGSSNRILVDDYDVNIDEFAKRGFSALQVPRLWNRLHWMKPVDYVREFLDVPIRVSVP